MLERQRVDRLLAEQGLSLGGLVDADRAVKVGKVLAADLLAIVESSPKSQGRRRRHLRSDQRRAAVGLGRWPPTTARKAAEAIVNAVREAAAKHAAGSPICTRFA